MGSCFLFQAVVSLHRLGSVMSVLHDTVASYDAADKLKVELTNTSEPRRRSFLSVIYAPFRSFAGDVFLWESRDYLFYAVVGFYLAVSSNSHCSLRSVCVGITSRGGACWSFNFVAPVNWQCCI